ncbi:hypothetical protein Y032_0497g2506 [Ancylostoma ceylanicum]|uniref:Uncharacterized protein n=1 Tax=Ancylostoma ceylanicum TaxID=53326 RepID=A0A016WUJ0_9BILA|nr:hypothetical protein Y032_0497g2506 [Ancylostoma ceylanicum]
MDDTELEEPSLLHTVSKEELEETLAREVEEFSGSALRFVVKGMSVEGEDAESVDKGVSWEGYHSSDDMRIVSMPDDTPANACMDF